MNSGSLSAAAGVAEDGHHTDHELALAVADITAISIQDRKDHALHVLKSELMAKLNKEVKSLDDDSWMFDGPRSRIHLISRPEIASRIDRVKDMKEMEEKSLDFLRKRCWCI